MIAFIKGRLVEKSPTEVIIDCNGVGYQINISLHTYAQLPTSENIILHTYFQVKEDSQTLYGFAEKTEKEIFKLLISVSGIGGNTARNMLSHITPKDLISAIAANDYKTIQSVKGIGVKTAQRLVIDLQEKVIKLFNVEELSVVYHNTNSEEALSALEVLGFVRKSAEKIVKKIVEQNPDATVELIIKQALKNL
nr:Holliday junction branch migration protein RuvA [uncultured Flavobacterium sp.]